MKILIVIASAFTVFIISLLVYSLMKVASDADDQLERDVIPQRKEGKY